MKLFINAQNIHTGGGRVLLEGLLAALDPKSEGALLLDKRFTLPTNLPRNYLIRRIAPTVYQRLKAELYLQRYVEEEDIVICFGNLPPLFRLKGSVFVFVQNRYLFETKNLDGFSFAERLRIIFERILFELGKHNATSYVVQTPSMQHLSLKIFGQQSILLPFVNNPKGYRRTAVAISENKCFAFDFLYIASGDPHKNHKILIHAWMCLAHEGIRPSLVLTVDSKSNKSLSDWIVDHTNKYNLNIKLIGEKSFQDVEYLYENCRALIYPSVFETIGLPLIEARCHGLPILASELDYVRDVLDPEETFNPYSATSIARAVKRFLDLPEPTLPLIDAKSFINTLISQVN